MSKLMLLLGLSLMVTLQASADVKVEKMEYKGWRNCYRVTNGEIELVVTSDVGPRVMRFGFVGGQNLFKEFADQLGGTREEKHQEIVSGKLPRIRSRLGRQTTCRLKSRLLETG
jgi:hypothetical protein